MPLTVGGGVRTLDGHPRSCCRPAPTRCRSTPRPSRTAQFVREAAEKFGAQCIVVAIDAKQVSAAGEPGRWEIFTHGGRNPTGIDAVDFARDVVALGAGEILLTSMDRDGTKAGFDLELTRADLGCGHACRSSPRAASARSIISSTASPKATPAPCWRPRSSTSAPIRSAQAKRHMAAAGIAVRLDASSGAAC